MLWRSSIGPLIFSLGVTVDIPSTGVAQFEKGRPLCGGVKSRVSLPTCMQTFVFRYANSIHAALDRQHVSIRSCLHACDTLHAREQTRQKRCLQSVATDSLQRELPERVFKKSSQR